MNTLTSLCQTNFEQILPFPSSALVKTEKNYIIDQNSDTTRHISLD